MPHRTEDAVYTRNRLAAFNATTGVVDTAFAPNVNGSVNAVIPSNDPASMYIAGTFTSVGTTARQRIARVSTATGQVITTFNAGTVNGQIRDIRLVGSTLYIAGDFSTVGTSSRSRLAALNADTGAVLGSLNLPFAGVHNGGSTNVFKIDVTPDGGRLLAIGNFATVAGVNRRQIAMIDLTTNPATLAGWHTNFYTSTCASAFNTYMRDLDISEDGTFAVVSTTGAYRANTACDTISRFPVQTNAANLTPTWINYTGGDTSYAVEIHDGVAYVGGHMRWVNNPFAGDSAGAGAVPREGIVALDVVNGLPFSWNPGRSRGVGVFDFHVTAAGLWAGSDTLTWAGEQRHRLAFFPFAGGIAVPPDVVGSLPNDVYTLGRLSGGGTTQDDVQRRFYTGTGAPGATTVTPGTVQWRNTRGAFMVGSTLFAGQSNGTFTRRSFNGTTFGAATTIALFNNTIIADLPNITGMFYDPVDARIYYTMSGQSSLFYRGFTPESGVIGAARFTATGSVGSLNPTRVRGMFLSGGNIFFADNTTGNLFRIGFAAGAVSGNAVLADASTDWRGRDMFVWTGNPTQTTNQPPVASFTAVCSGLSCDFNAGSSSDDVAITSYEWAFQGGGTETGVITDHDFGAPGEYTVTLTVRDGPGLSDTESQQVMVDVLPNEPPVAAFTYTCSALACDFNAADSSDDVAIASYEWDFGGDGEESGITAHHDFSGAGAYQVVLTVTDGDGETDTDSQVVQVTDVVPDGPAFRAAASSNANTTNASVVVPASVQAGDQLVLIVTINRSTTLSTPAGWTLLGQAADGTPRHDVVRVHPNCQCRIAGFGSQHDVGRNHEDVDGAAGIQRCSTGHGSGFVGHRGRHHHAHHAGGDDRQRRFVGSQLLVRQDERQHRLVGLRRRHRTGRVAGEQRWSGRRRRR